jgi:YesN/AraC family two-component response regulator
MGLSSFVMSGGTVCGKGYYVVMGVVNQDQIQDSQAMLKIIIADDVMETRRSTRLMLSLVPDVKVVATAENGREVVELTQTFEPDVILLDVNMPEMSGLEALAAIRAIQPHAVCIILSVERANDTVEEAMEKGAHDYLIKPFTTEQLMAVMQRAREEVMRHRWNLLQDAKYRQALAEREQMKLLADQYIAQKRTDAQAMAVLERLAADPDCDLHYLRTLAIIYVFRQKWRRLKLLAHHLEKRSRL